MFVGLQLADVISFHAGKDIAMAQVVLQSVKIVVRLAVHRPTTESNLSRLLAMSLAIARPFGLAGSLAVSCMETTVGLGANVSASAGVMQQVLEFVRTLVTNDKGTATTGDVLRPEGSELNLTEKS